VKRPWFRNQPVDASFFESAPVVISDAMPIRRSAEQVWSDLTMDATLWWCRILDRVEWTSERPFGVGTTRTVTSLKGANVIREHFFRWEQGRRKSFYVVEASGPMFRALAEDYVVEPAGENACSFTWTIAFEPKSALRPMNAANKAILRTLFKDTRKHYGAG
jgi:hypothetical protein